MLYQEYKLKIEKRMAFWKWVRRWRVPIIATIATVLALALAFVFTKGMVRGAQISESKIEYGKEPTFSANALFADVWYEYRQVDSTEWSDKIPTQMGEYRVRGVSRGIFGTRYGEEMAFTIVPREIEVYADGKRVIYGENPLPTASLAFDDTVYCGRFVFADTTNASTEATPVLESIIIKDKNGNDVTNCYKIKVKTKEVVFSKRDITVIVDSMETEYDGDTHTHEVWQIAQGGGLVYEDVLVKVDGSFAGATDFGTVDNRGEFRIIRTTDKGVSDVTHQYNINQIAGKLTITQRPVVILPNGGEYTYDGQEHREYGFEVSVETPLVDGHTASVESAPAIKNVGEINNFPTIAIKDSDGKTVTGNYSITYSGNYVLKVNPLDTSITAESGELVYNGKDNTFENCTVTDGFFLAQGHTVTVKEATLIKNEGVYTNEITVTILDENGEDVTSNYNVSYISGEVVVTKREISITSATLDGTYNGEEQGEKTLIIVKDQLVEGHRVEATFYNTVKECGIELDNTFDAVILDENGEDVTANYEMSRYFGKLKVNQLTIRIKTDSAEKVYDGTPLKAESFSYVSGSATIVEGHTIEYIDAPSVTDVPYFIFNTVRNTFTIKIYEDGVDKTFNYNIIYESYGYLSIIQRQLSVSADGYTKTYYDGLPVEDLTYTVGEDGVAPNQRLEVSTHVEERTKAGTWKYRITGVKVYDANDVDVTKNYYIEKKNATLYIGKRPILVTSNGFADTVYYDGEQHREETYVLDSPAGEPLAAGESISISFNKNSYAEYATNDVENKFTVDKIYNLETGEKTTSNYEISTVYGTLHLEKRPVYLISDSIPENTVVYDGYMHKQESYTDDSQRGMGIVEGQSVIAVYDGYIVNAGEEENAFYVSKIYDKRGVNVVDSYDISYESGILRVYARPITLTSQSATKVYDANPLTREDVLIGGLGVADGEYVEFSNFTYQLGFGSVKNKFDYVIKYNDGGEVPPTNYNVTTDFAGVLEVTKRPVYITIKSHEKAYDGLALRPAGYSTPRYDDVYERGEGILPHHTLSMKLTGERWLVGTQVIGYEDVRISHDYNAGFGSVFSDNYTYNYELIITDGTLTVTQREVVLDAPDQTAEYDGTCLAGMMGPQDVIGGLGKNDVLHVVMTGEQINVGTSDTQIVEYWIIHAKTTNVTHCYDVKEILDGTVTVTPRQLVITVLGDTKEYYDGGAVLPKGYEFDRLLENHTASLELIGEQINVGKSYAEVVDGTLVILNESGDDVTYNYEYSVKGGELIVANKRPITITSASDQFTYNSEAHKNESYVIGGMGLATEREEYEVVTFTGDLMINSGIYENSFDVNIVLSETGEDVTDNYEIERVFGEIEIVSVKIKVTTGSGAKEFDLMPLTSSEISYICNNLPNGYRIEASTIGTITNAGSVPNDYTITIYDEHGNLADLRNFEIEEELGELTVTPIKLTITSGSADKTYDGKYLTDSSFVSNWEETDAYKSGLLNLVVTTTGKRRDVGRSNNTFIVALYDNKGVNHLDGNCELTSEYGKLTVYAAPITITSNTVTTYYNGRTVEKVWAEITSGELGRSHVMKAKISIAPIDVGTYENTFTFDIFDENENSVLEFYRDVTKEYGTVTINPYKIVIKPVSVNRQYAGEPIYAPGEIVLPNEYLDELNSDPLYKYTYSIDDMSDVYIDGPGQLLYYSIPSERVHIYLNGEELSADGFDITSQNGYLKLSEKLIEINVFKIVKTYNGKLISYKASDYSLKAGQLPEGYTFDMTLEGGLTDVGSVDFDVIMENLLLNNQIHVYDENGIEVTERYGFVLVGTPLTVTERFIEITAGSAQRYYDGQALTCDEYKITGGSLAKGHKISVCKINGTVTDVGTVMNRITSIKIVDENGEDVTSNYNVQDISGVLEILERPQ